MTNMYGMGEPGQDRFDSEKLALLSKYVDKQTTPQENARVEEWLATDPLLYHTFTSLLQDAEKEFGLEEQQEAIEIVGLTADDIFANIKKMTAEPNPGVIPVTKPNNVISVPWWRQVPVQLAAAAVLLLGLIGGPQVYDYWHFDRVIDQALVAQLENHTQDLHQARLSDAYRGESIPMSPEEAETELEKQLLAAIDFKADDDDTEARRRLANEYFLLGKSDKLRREFEWLKGVENKSAKLLNDLGTFVYKLKPLDGAKEANTYFQAALEQAPENSIYQYNLALTQEELGNLKEAKRLLEACLRTEKDEGWEQQIRKNLTRIEAAETPP